MLRLLLRDADRGMSFTELLNQFPGGISKRGLTDALDSLEKARLIGRSTLELSKGAHSNYRITHPGPEELVIDDVVRFLQREPQGSFYTGVLWMGSIVSSDKEFGLVLSEDNSYNEAFLKLFLLVHDKWRSHILKEYADSNRLRELKIIERCENALLACCRAYGLTIESPFTERIIPVETMEMVHYDILHVSQTIRGAPARSGKRYTYVDALLDAMAYADKEGKSTPEARALADPHRKYMSKPANQHVYETFLSKSVPPESVLFIPFGFSSPMGRFLELMSHFAAVHKEAAAASSSEPRTPASP